MFLGVLIWGAVWVGGVWVGMLAHGQVIMSLAPGWKRMEYLALKEWPVAHLNMVTDARRLWVAVAACMAGGGVGFRGGVQAM